MNMTKSGVVSKSSLPHGGSILTRFGLWLAVVLTTGVVWAGTIWDGGSAVNSQWNTAANWDSDVAPTFNNTADLTFGDTTTSGLYYYTNSLGSGARVIRSLTFNSNLGSMNTIMGLNNGATIARSLTIGGAGAAAITVNSGANGNITIGAGIGTVIGGFILGESLPINHNGGGNLTIDAVISGSYGITKSGSGTNTLTGVNTFTGPVTNSAGMLIAGDNVDALGKGDLVLNGGTLRLVGSTNRKYDRPTTVTTSSTVQLGSTVNASRTYTFGTLTIGAQTLTTARNVITGVQIGNLVFQTSTTLTGSPVFNLADRANVTLAAVSDGASDYNLTKQGAGTLTLNGLGDYSGQTFIQGGVISINSITNVGAGNTSAIGAPATVANGTIAIGSTTTGGTLALTGTAGATTDRVIDLAGTTGGATIDANQTAGILKFTSDFTATGSGSKALTISGTSTEDNEIAGVITNGPTGSTALTKGDTGKWILSSGNSSFSGQVQINNGTLQATSIKNSGLNSSLGNPGAGLEAIKIGYSVNPSATLIYAGTGDTSDRPIDLSGQSCSSVIDQSGSGLLKFTAAANTATGAGTKALVLQGSTSGAGEISGVIPDGPVGSTGVAVAYAVGDTTIALCSVDGIVVGATITGTGIPSATTVSSVDPVTRVVGLSKTITVKSATLPTTVTVAGVRNLTALAKAGTGTWTLSGTNTYSSDTLVSAGTLFVNGLISSTNTAVEALATLGGTGTVNGSVSVASGAYLAPGAPGVGTLTITNNLSLNGSTLVFDITNNTGNADLIVVGGTLTPSAVTTVSLNNQDPLPNGDYVLIQTPSTLGGSAANFTVSSPSPSKSYTIVYDGNTNVVLQVADNTRAVTWTGEADGNWDIETTANWTNVLAGGSDTYQENDPVTFDDIGVSVRPDVTLTTVVSPLSVTVNSSGNYTFEGPGGINGASTLEKSGAGTLTMAVSNSYSGTTTVSGGRLSITNDTALGAVPGSATAGSLTLNGGTLKVKDVTLNANRGLALGVAGGTIESVSGTSTYNGIAAGVDLTKTGAGLLALGGANTFAGSLSVLDGTLAVTNINNGVPGPLGDNANVVTLGAAGATGTLKYSGVTATSTKKFTVPASGTGALEVSGSGEMLTLSATDSVAGLGTFAKAGDGVLELTGANTGLTGELKLGAGVLKASAANTTCLGAGTLRLSGGELLLASGAARNYGRNATVDGSSIVTSDKTAAGAGVTYTFGTLDIGAQTLTVQGGTNAVSGTAGVTFSGAATLSGAANFVISTNGLGTATALTLGSTVDNGGFTPTFDGAGNATVAGDVSGSGGLVKAGAGALTLNGVNTYSGDTTISGGILTIGSTGQLGSGTYAANITNNASFVYNGTASQLLSGVLTGSGALTKSGTGLLTLSNVNSYQGGTTVSAGLVSISDDGSASGPNTLGDTAGAFTFSGGGLQITSAGPASAWNLNRALNFTGAATFDIVNSNNTYTVGAPAITAAGDITKAGQGVLTIANVLDMGAAGNLIVKAGRLDVTTDISLSGSTTGKLRVGVAAGDNAAVLQSGGRVSFAADGANAQVLGDVADSFGAYTVVGGNYAATRGDIGDAGYGVLNVLSGGTATFSTYLIGGRSAGGMGTMSIAGGSVTNNGPGSNTGTWGAGRFEMNVGVNLGGANAGGSLVNTSTTATFNLVNNNTAGSGILNLNGGTMTAYGISAMAGVTGLAELNFNGGTLKANAANAAFITANVLNADVHSGGGTIDNDGFAITIPKALVAPAGSGVASISASGAGYFAPPYVKFASGGNNDATAVATIDGSGNITGVVITSPGTGYTVAPDITLVGGNNGEAGTATATLNSGNASGGMTFTGSGTTTLSGANTYGGDTVVSNGTLALGAANIIPNGTGKGSVNLAVSGATFALSGFSETINGLSGVAGTVIDGVSGTPVLTVGDNDQSSAFSGVITNSAGTLSLVKTGAGTLTLSGLCAHNGATTVSAGTLALSGDGAISNSASISIAGGAVLDVTGVAGSFTLDAAQTLKGNGTVLGAADIAGTLAPGDDGTAGTLTVSNVIFQSGSVVKFDLVTAQTEGADVNDLVVVNGDLAAGGTIRITVLGQLSTSGSYRLFNYSGALTGSFAVEVPGSHYTATLDTGTAGQVNVSFSQATPASSLTWKGTSLLPNWDINTSANWFDGVGAALFLTPDNVLFDGTAENNSATLVGTLVPSSVTVDSGTGTNITLTGSGKISGSSGLTKSGTSRLNVATASTYDGLTVVQAGELALTAATATLGSTAAGTVVSNGAALRIQGVNMTLDEPLTLAGTGVGGTGNNYGAVVMNLNGGIWTLNGAIVLNGNAAINTYKASPGSVTITKGISGMGNLTLRSSASNNGYDVYHLQGQSSYAGDTVLDTFTSQGITVRCAIDNALPTNTVLRIKATSGTTTYGKFALNGYSQTVAGLEGSVAANTLNSIVGGAATLSTLTVSNTSDYVYSGQLGNSGTDENNLALVKAGTGLLTLTATNNSYAGGTTVNEGTLAVDGKNVDTGLLSVNGGTLAGAGSLAGSVSVGSGATLAAGRDGTAGTLTVGALTCQSGSVAKFDLTTDTAIDGGTNDLVVVNGDLAAGGTIRINVLSPLSTSGSYRLFNYTGNLSGSFAIEVPGSRYTATLDTGTPNQINVSFTVAAETLTWKGTEETNDWDIGTSANWDNGSGASVFMTPDAVSFDGTAETNVANLVGTLVPGSVAVNASVDVELTGSGKISGGTDLSKSGSGTLTIGTANDFTGATAVNNGTVKLGSATALGTAAGDTSVAGGAVLDLNGQGTVPEPVKINGTGLASGGALLNSSATAATLSGAVTLESASSIGGSGDIVASGDVAGAFGLTKVGAGVLTLNSTAKSLSGDTEVAEGTLDLVAPATGSTLSSPLLTVKSGAVAVVRGTGSALGDSTDVAIEAGGLMDLQKNDTMGGLSGAGTVRLTTPSGFTFQVNNGNETTEFSGTIENPGAGDLALTKNGTGTLTLSGANAHSGVTTVSVGTLKVKNSNALGATAGGTVVANNATLALDGSAGNLSIGAEALNLKGIGASGAKGALQNTAGDNLYSGAITLTAEPTCIGSYGGSLTLDVASGNAISGNYNLELRGDGGSITINDPVTIGTKTLTKSYGSQVTLNATVTYGKLLHANGVLSMVNIPDVPISSGNGSNVCTLRYVGVSDVLLTSAILLGNVSSSDATSTTVIENESAGNVIKLNSGVTVSPTSAKPQVFRLAGSNAGDNTMGGAISNGVGGMVSLVKVGTGTWALTGENTYTGGTLVAAGTLLVNNATGSGTGSGVVVVTNATLGGVGSMAGAVSVLTNARLAPGTNTVAGGVLTCGSLSLAAGVTNAFDCTSTANDSVAVVGALAIQGANTVALSLTGETVPSQITIATFGSVTGDENLSSWTVTGIPSRYSSRVRRVGNSIVVVNFLRGTIIRID